MNVGVRRPVLVDELASAVPDVRRGSGHAERDREAERSRDAADAAGREAGPDHDQRDDRGPQQPLRGLLVLLDVTLGDDLLHALFLVLARLEREPAAADQQRLEQHHEGPAARRHEAQARRDERERRHQRDQDRQRDRQVNDRGMEGIGKLAV